MNPLKKFGMLVTMLSTFTSASAYDFIADGIAYSITSFSDFECTVSSADVSYEGDIVIPAEVIYNGKRLTVVSIEDAAFENSAITSVILPKSITKIGEKSFYGCNSLHTVSLNEGLHSIGTEAFSNCALLQGIQFPQTLQSIEASCFEQCTSLEVVVFPQALTTLGESSFKGCSNLKEVTLTDNLTTLEANTFDGCKKLSSISWGNNILQIKDYAFADCGFETFYIPNSVIEIGASILSGNQNLRSFTIGNGLSKISSDPIDGCSNVKELIIADGNSFLTLDYSPGDYQRIGTVFYSDNTGAAYCYIRPGAYATVPLEYIYIGRQLLNPENFYHYTLPPFHGNKNIKTVEFGSNVSSLSDVSFTIDRNRRYSYGWLENCTNIENLRIAGLTDISQSFVKNATSLKSVELPNNTATIGDSAFWGCI